jgi:hypothetical protein
MRRIIGLCLALAMLIVLTPAEAQMYKGTETAAYTVERTVEGAELRSYGPRLVAKVTVSGSRSGAANAGFRILAGYIFGANSQSSKIAMTTPVAQVPDAPDGPGALSPGADGAQSWTVRFTMPSDRSLAGLPPPDDPRIRLLETAPERMLVLQFTGRPTDAALAKATASLLAIAERAGVAGRGAPEFLFYDSPFTLPWNRRNEVALVLD